ncbi:hypothetical protein [Actinopolymorpha sp. B9G3]|uniref:hypothetical protein n=1 Tax=Actinopolymorpha sp. B9G3 TaxID=3158970 RepID=UPI0032D98BEF
MTKSKYERVAALISQIRNARFGEMVDRLEELIDSGIWQDFTTPIGTHFKFKPCEFDYFLAAQEIDPTLIRWAYLQAEGVEGLAAKQLRLADITGRGKPPEAGARRPLEHVAAELARDSSGAAQRIRAWGERNAAVVNQRTSRIARDPERRKDVEAGKNVKRDSPNLKVWQVRWHDDRSYAEAIVDQLQRDPDLAKEVYKTLDASHVRTSRGKRTR